MTDPLVRLISPGDVYRELTATLAGSGPIAPLPHDDLEASQVIAMVQPEIGVCEPDAAVIVATSGSTGTPKGVILSRAAMIASADATHERLGGPGTWVRALPEHYVAGLMVLTRTIVAGTSPHSVTGDLADLPRMRAAICGRAYLSVVPTQLTRALAEPEIATALASFDAVLLGGAAASPQLLKTSQNKGIRVVTTYGMSETCGGCVYDGVPLAWTRVELDQDQRITLGGPLVFSGYRLQPELTAETLINGAVRTQDRGHWAGDRLQVTGRIDDIVISGGVNVDLAAVQGIANSWPGLDRADVVIIGLPDPEWGTRVVAVVDHETGSLDDLRMHVSSALPRHAAPRELIRVNSLPRTSSGKINRRQLVADLSPAERNSR